MISPELDLMTAGKKNYRIIHQSRTVHSLEIREPIKVIVSQIIALVFKVALDDFISFKKSSRHKLSCRSTLLSLALIVGLSVQQALIAYSINLLKSIKVQ